MDWLDTCTDDDKALLDRALELEGDLFSDMTLEDFAEELGGHDAMIDGKWVRMVDDLCEPGALDIIESGWRFRVVDDSVGFWGSCTPDGRLIEIAESQKNDDITLMHELIHAYEHVLADMTELYKQWLIIRLYEQVLPKIPYVSRLLTFDASPISTASSGRCHGPLFLLKSLELDLRLGKPPGTVYGYGREEDFASYIEHLARQTPAVPSADEPS